MIDLLGLKPSPRRTARIRLVSVTFGRRRFKGVRDYRAGDLPMTPSGLPKRALLALLPVLVLASAAAARAAHITPVRLASQAGPDLSTLQGPALLPDGRFAVLLRTGDGSGYDADTTTFLQYVDVDGRLALQRPGVVVSTSPSGGSQATLVAHPHDGVFVAVRRVLDGESSRISVQWFDGQGRPRWGAGRLAAPVVAAESQSEPYLVASPDGGVSVCFVGGGQAFAGAVYCQRFSPEGRRLWGRRGARTGPSSSFVELPKALAAADGGLFVFWSDAGPPGGPENRTYVRGQRLGPDGDQRWGDGARIVTENRLPDPIAFQLPWVEAVSDGIGGAIVACDDWVGPIPEGVDTNHVTVRRISADGEDLWGEGVSVMPSRPPHVLYSLVASPDGGAFVGVGQMPFSIDEFWIHIAFQRLDADGRLLWPAGGARLTKPRSVTGWDFEEPRAAFDGQVLRVAWEHEMVDTRTWARSSEILFTAFDAAGNRLTDRESIAFTDAREYTALGGFALDPETGTSLVVWRGRDPGAGYYAEGVVYTPPP